MPLYWQSQVGTPVPTLSVTQPWLLGSLFGVGTNSTTGGYYQAGATNSATIWASNDVNSTQYYYLAQQRAVYYHEITAEQRRQAEAAQALRLQQYEEQERKRKAALERSRELLLSHLTNVQRKTFETNKWFIVEGGKTKKKYRVRCETYAGNIDVLVGAKVEARLCCHCDGVPLYDHHVAQKLALEYDEERFLRIANRTAA